VVLFRNHQDLVIKLWLLTTEAQSPQSMHRETNQQLENHNDMRLSTWNSEETL